MPPAMTSANTSCIVCLKENAKLCTRCKNLYYCSKSCQKSDWRTHKLLCSDSSFDASSRPSDKHFLAIYFPVDDSKPNVVWMQFKDGKHQHPIVDSYFQSEHLLKSLQENSLFKRKLSDTIHIVYSDTAPPGEPFLNECIAGISAAKPGRRHDWRGPVIAYGTVGLNLNQTECRDLTMADFKHIADHFLWYGHEPLPKIQGVRVNCVGDRNLGRPLYEAVEVPPTHAIFSEHETPDVPKILGLPVLTSKYPPHPVWLADRANYDNIDATFLHLSCDPNDYVPFSAATYFSNNDLGWGWAPRRWQSFVGSILMVRQDRKPLHPLHAESLCQYCVNHLQPLFEDSLGMGQDPENPISKEEVLARINQRNFLSVWRDDLDLKRQLGQDTNAPNPYDV